MTCGKARHLRDGQELNGFVQSLIQGHEVCTNNNRLQDDESLVAKAGAQVRGYRGGGPGSADRPPVDLPDLGPAALIAEPALAVKVR